MTTDSEIYYMYDPEEKWIMVQDTEEARKMFYNNFTEGARKNLDTLFVSPEEMHNKSKSIREERRAREEDKRREELENPKVDEDIKAISSNEELIEYLLSSYEMHTDTIINEFSGDFEYADAQLKAEMEVLRSKALEHKEVK